MKVLLLTYFLFLSLLVSAQTDSQYHDDLKIFTTQFTNNDIINPYNTRIFIDSVISISEGLNLEITLIKEESSWPNGQIQFTRFYQNNIPYGTWKYHTQNGLLKYTLKNFETYFIIQLHFENNNIRSARKYPLNSDKDVVGCVEELYFPDGSLQAFGKKDPQIIINHWELLENGKWSYFYPSGVLESKGKFINGKKEGRWSYFDQSGNKLRYVKFKSGILVSQKKLTR
jgi:hypothetical protein